MAPALDWAASASEKKRNCCHYPRTSQTSDHIRHTTWNLHCCLLPRTFGNRQPVSPLSGTSDRYISASQLLKRMQTPHLRLNQYRMGLLSKSKPLFETQDLLAEMAAFGPSTTLPDWVQTQPRRSSHADSVTNQILQASANFQNLSQSRYPLLHHNLS